MCRLLGFVSDQKRNFPELFGNDFQEFIELSKIHCDGWGLSNIGSDEKVAQMTREPVMAAASGKFREEIANLSTDGALLHIRWATPGLPIKVENNHPFIYKDITFTHNGSIKPATALNDEIDSKYLALCQGDTDSERYFYYILTEIDKSDFVTGIKNAVNYVRKNKEYSSINGMIMNEEYYVAIAEYDLTKIPAIFTEDYYELRFKKSQESVIVGSSGWNQAGWEVLPNHHLLVVNRKTLDVEIIKLDA
jgi:predicted glutamine amidotransferase